LIRAGTVIEKEQMNMELNLSKLKAELREAKELERKYLHNIEMLEGFKKRIKTDKEFLDEIRKEINSLE